MIRSWTRIHAFQPLVSDHHLIKRKLSFDPGVRPELIKNEDDNNHSDISSGSSSSRSDADRRTSLASCPAEVNTSRAQGKSINFF